MLQCGTTLDGSCKQYSPYRGDSMDGTNAGRFSESSARSSGSLLVSRFDPDDTREHHGGISRLS